ncbi:MAG: hypothetical protein IKZ44_02485 [Clostridia bacterium]|nr:hypothetical protein [Clostridia bacterium]
MSTSGTERKLSAQKKLILIDLIAALFCALFGAVYEAFGHGVYSYGMLYAFAFPLAMGVLPLYLIDVLHAPYPGKALRELWHAGIATLTVGSIVTGVLEIYGTTNPLTIVYWILGAAFIAAGAVGYAVFCFGRKQAA